MRPAPIPRHRARGTLVAALVSLVLLGAAAAPVAATQPGPIQLPAISGLVVDACTGLPITGGLDVTVVNDAGAVIHPPSPNRLGLFSFRTLDPGTYQLMVSAPGYAALGTGDPATGASPGVRVTVDPGPQQLPAGQSFSEGLVLAIGLVPELPPSPCRPPSPNLPALAGRGTDTATGTGLRGLSVGLSPLVPVGIDPGPVQAPTFRPLLGFFAFGATAPGSYLLLASAPGHEDLATLDPATGAATPGVQVTVDPGPVNLPAGEFVAESLVVAFSLPAVQAPGS